ncbi:bifunctional indole-3-glycerol-phosphate synthase TrpC/phosphoribosylanthranilate isomerase TrpF [Buchnera aphidicola]|uniref:bifunctional indole-3-glycerol-phosphate synthase TrpC/phosphoribosylanthranilate isomerase TrpF n=1 Tax=Buchnera aphidicola TaxID=9 RepID=UPI003463E10D
MQQTILQEIIKNKLIWLKINKKKQPLINFKNKIQKTNRNFYQSIKNVHPFFILECKQSSPSSGIIRKKFDIVDICHIYKKYASVISVLTDKQYFNGKLEFIPKVSAIVSQPILCKDFFIDPYQVYLARYYQADAILLMLSILSDQEYKVLSKIATDMNMGILTEVNNKIELNRAILLKAKVIGINNRNLHDFSIDLNRTKIMAPLIPNDIKIVSESGINNYSQIRELSKLVHGFLIGSSLMLQKDLDMAIRKMIMGDNKICGLTREKDAVISKRYGAIYGGLIFVKNSKRYINENVAIKIIDSANLNYVGVFRNEHISYILTLSKLLNLKAIQLHGNEDQNYINKLRVQLPYEIEIWKACGIKNISPNYNFKNVNYYIFDNSDGGSGKSFNWSILSNCNLSNVILAGGLNSKNCIFASKLGCAGLDFNSGVEDDFGKKNSKKIASVFHSLRNYF